MQNEIKEIISHYSNASRDQLIPILQEVQDKLGYLPKEAMAQVGKELNLPSSKIYGVATFYNQFRFAPKGKYHIQLCRGTACHVLGSATVLDELEKILKIKAGETTKDGLFSIEVVACIGACGLGVVLNINGNFHAKVTTQSLKEIIEKYRLEAETAEA